MKRHFTKNQQKGILSKSFLSPLLVTEEVILLDESSITRKRSILKALSPYILVFDYVTTCNRFGDKDLSGLCGLWYAIMSAT